MEITSSQSLAPDYLGAIFGRAFFHRDGLSFSLNVSNVSGVCYFHIYFQNQYDLPSIGQIALRPAAGMLGMRAKIETISVEVHCEPAAFGIVRIPMPLAKKVQGTRQKFEVGASVSYPQGKGRRLRFADGMLVSTSTDFVQLLSRAPTAEVLLPTNVAEEIDQDRTPVIETYWKLGDPPLETTRASEPPNVG